VPTIKCIRLPFFGANFQPKINKIQCDSYTGICGKNVPKLSDLRNFFKNKIKKEKKDLEHILGGLESHNRVMNGWINSTISQNFHPHEYKNMIIDVPKCHRIYINMVSHPK
jgi:hypothetical protein